MPIDTTENTMRIRQRDPAEFEPDSFRTIALGQDTGIQAVRGVLKEGGQPAVQTLLFDRAKWDEAAVKDWIAAHTEYSWPATQAETADGEPIPLEATDTPQPKYVKRRLHDPAAFSDYRTKALRLTPFADGIPAEELQGIQASMGIWKRTGALTLQQLLFETAAGWTNESVDEWLAKHKQFATPKQPEQPALQQVTDTLCDLPATLAATGDPDYKVFAVHVIREGWGKNRRLGADGRYYQDYFPKPFLQDLAPMLEGSAVQAVKLSKDDAGALPAKVEAAIAELRRHGHPPQAVNVLLDQGLIGNTVGFFKQAEFADNAVQDETGQARAVDRAMLFFADTPAAEATRQLVKFAWNKGFKQSLGLSINYRANASFGEVEGRPAFIFDRPTHHVSTEIVANPAANGGLIAVIQSMAEPLLTAQEQGSPQPVAADAATPNQSEHPKDAPVTQAAQPDPAILSKLTALETLLQKQAEVQATQAQQLAEYRAREVRAALEVHVTQSTVLDADVKAAMLAAIADGSLTTETQVKLAVKTAELAIQKAVAAVQAAQPVPVFPGLARPSAEILRSPTDTSTIRSKLYWDLPLTQAEQDMATKYGIRPYTGIKEEYIAVTGDQYMQFHGLDMDRFKTMTAGFTQAAATTNTYPEFMRNVIEQRVVRHWSKVNKDHLKLVSIGDQYTDTRDEEEFLIGSVDDIAEVAENGNYEEIAWPYTEKVTSSSQKRGNILAFSEEVILNDRGKLIKQVTDAFTGALNRTMARQIYDMLFNYGGSPAVFNGKDVDTSATNGVLYATSLGNYVDGHAYDIEKVRTLVDAMMSQTDIAPEGETGEEMALEPYIMVCNKVYQGVVLGIVNGKYEITSANIDKSLSLDVPAERIVGIHQNFMRSKPTALVLLPNPSECSFMELRYFYGKTTPDLVFEGNQQPQYGYAFASDRMLLKLKMRWRLTLQRKKAPFALFPSA